MENASKALLMAGGILIAILILSLLVYMATTTTRLAKTQDEKTLAEQTAAFNGEYESYNKTRMYGTDVITVVNKAIDYNRKLGTDEEKYKINIILELNQTFNRTEQVIKQNADGTKEFGEVTTIKEGTLNKGTYELFERKDSTKMNDDVINFFGQKSDDEIEDNRHGETIYRRSAITNFKTAIFKCTGVEYNDITGRIKSMTFTQI